MELDASLSWLALALTSGLALALVRSFVAQNLDHLIASFALQKRNWSLAVCPRLRRKLSIIRMLSNARKGTGRDQQPLRLPPPELNRAGTILRRCCKFTSAPVLFNLRGDAQILYMLPSAS